MNAKTFSTTILLCLAGVLHLSARADEIHVCVTAASGCDYHGPGAVQRAVDAADSGDTVLLSPGQHTTSGHRDIEFESLIIRAGVLVQDKALALRGLPGTILASSEDQPASTIVVHRGSVVLEQLLIRSAPPVSSEDDIYDGHGVFVVDGSANLRDVELRDIKKMALSVRGKSEIVGDNVRIIDGHVGVWTEESAQVSLKNCVIENNDSAAVAAYMQSKVELSDCVLEKNADDGLYGEEDATLKADQVLFIRNTPYAVRAVEGASAAILNSVFYGNKAISNDPAAVTVTGALSLPAGDTRP